MGGYNGSGSFNFTYSWTNDAANGVPITASRMDTQFGDATSGFDLCLTRDGQSTTTAIIPFASGITLAGGNTFTTYVEGLWTPIDGSGAGIVFADKSGSYTKIGRMVFAQGYVQYPSTANASAAVIGGLPYPVPSVNNQIQAFVTLVQGNNFNLQLAPINGTSTIQIYRAPTGAAISATATNAQVTVTSIYFSAIYQAAS